MSEIQLMIISVIDANDQLSEAVLDGQTFYVGLSWNETAAHWTLSIRNSEDTAICSGIKLLPFRALLFSRRKPGIPKGELFVYAPTLARLERDSFIKSLATLFYIRQEDLLAEGIDQYLRSEA